MALVMIFRVMVIICVVSAPVIIYRKVYPALNAALSGNSQKQVVDYSSNDPAYLNSATKSSPVPTPGSRFERNGLIPSMFTNLPGWSILQTVFYVFLLHLFLKKLYSDAPDRNRLVVRRDSQGRLNLQKAYKKAARSHGAELKAVKQLLALYRGVVHSENCHCKDAYIASLLENNAGEFDASTSETPISLPEKERSQLLRDVRKRNRKIFDQNSKLQFMERSIDSLRRELSHQLSAKVNQHHVNGDGRGNGKTQPPEVDVLRAFQMKLENFIERSRQWQIEDLEVYDGENDDPLSSNCDRTVPGDVSA